MNRIQVRTTLIVLLLVGLGTGCGASSSVDQQTPLQSDPAQSAPAQTARAQTGVPFNLSTHCGIGPTTFRGRLWDPDSVEQGATPPADPVEPGTMHLEGENHAVFLGESGLRVDFSPAAADTPTPLCS